MLNKNLERKFFLALGLGFLVFLGLAVWGDAKKITHELYSFNWAIFPFALFLSLLNYLFRFFRWQFFLKVLDFNLEIKQRDSFLIFLSGLPMALTPLRTGELLKSHLLKKLSGIDKSATSPVLIVERLTDAFAMLILMSIGFSVFHYGFFLFLASLTAALLLSIVIQIRPLCLKLLSVLSLIKPIARRIHKFHNFYENSFKLIKFKNLLIGTIFGLFAWVCQIWGAFMILDSVAGGRFAGDYLFKATSFIFSFTAAMGFSIPVPGGLGVSETTSTGLISLLLGLSRSEAVTVTLLSRLSTIWFGFLVGIIALIILSKKHKNLL